MRYTSDFSSFARKQGIRDPFAVEMELFKKRCHTDKEGSIYIECDDLTEEEISLSDEKAKYIKARDEYVSDRLFQDFGYEVVFNKDYGKKYIPCEGRDCQCHMDCYMNGECKYDQSRESD